VFYLLFLLAYAFTVPITFLTSIHNGVRPVGQRVDAILQTLDTRTQADAQPLGNLHCQCLAIGQPVRFRLPW
jgi:hypothetical protein